MIKKDSPKNENMHVLVNGKLADSFGNVWQVLNILGEEEMVEDIKTFYENVYDTKQFNICL